MDAPPRVLVVAFGGLEFGGKGPSQEVAENRRPLDEEETEDELEAHKVEFDSVDLE